MCRRMFLTNQRKDAMSESNVVQLHPPVPGTISHLVGPDVTFRDLLRQRCQWCGVALVDEDLSLMAWPEEQGPPSFFWTVGRWVRIVPGNPSMMSLIETEIETCGECDTTLAPEDSCMFLTNQQKV